MQRATSGAAVQRERLWKPRPEGRAGLESQSLVPSADGQSQSLLPEDELRGPQRCCKTEAN